jgi:hypothetical protein
MNVKIGTEDAQFFFWKNLSQLFGIVPLSVSSQVSAKFSTCTVVGLNETLVESKVFTFALEYTHFGFNKCPI